MQERMYVLDTTAFIVGASFSFTDQLYTVPDVVNELRGRSDKQRFEYYQNAGLITKTPSKEYLTIIEERSKETGDSKRLSDVDKSLIALALELKATLVTDDYSLQNLAAVLDIEYQAVGERGIVEIIHWQLKCRGCGRIWDKPHNACPVCGTALKSSKKSGKKVKGNQNKIE
jgi:UPF0271 protein